MSEFYLQTSVFNSASTRVSGRRAKKSASAGRAVKATATAKPGAAEAAVIEASPETATKRTVKRKPRLADIVIRNRDSLETYAIQVKVERSTGEVVVSVLTADDERRHPVSEDLIRSGLELLFQRESRLERTAARYGIAADALLASLEGSAVDLTDESAGVPAAELQALRETGIRLKGSPTDPSGAAQVALGIARFQRFRDDALTPGQAAELLGVSDSRVRQLISSGEVVTIPNGEGHLLPSWQFAGNRLVPGLPKLIQAIDDVHPLTLASFMRTADVDLEVEGQPTSPIQWLLSGGDVEAVTELAASLATPS